MKKHLFLGLVIATSIVFTSCKKEYYCACTVNTTGEPIPVHSFAIKNARPKEAKKQCKERHYLLLNAGIASKCGFKVKQHFSSHKEQQLTLIALFSFPYTIFTNHYLSFKMIQYQQ